MTTTVEEKLDRLASWIREAVSDPSAPQAREDGGGRGPRTMSVERESGLVTVRFEGYGTSHYGTVLRKIAGLGVKTVSVSRDGDVLSIRRV
jgi:hypothetical protein